MDILDKYLKGFEKSKKNKFLDYLYTTDFNKEKAIEILKQIKLCTDEKYNNIQAINKFIDNKTIIQAINKFIDNKTIIQAINKFIECDTSLEPLDATLVIG